MYAVYVEGCRMQPFDGFYYPADRENFKAHDKLARDFAYVGYESATVLKDGEPVAIWSRHADH